MEGKLIRVGTLKSLFEDSSDQEPNWQKSAEAEYGMLQCASDGGHGVCTKAGHDVFSSAHSALHVQ